MRGAGDAGRGAGATGAAAGTAAGSSGGVTGAAATSATASTGATATAATGSTGASATATAAGGLRRGGLARRRGRLESRNRLGRRGGNGSSRCSGGRRLGDRNGGGCYLGHGCNRRSGGGDTRCGGGSGLWSRGFRRAFELCAQKIGDLRLDDAQLTFRLESQPPKKRDEFLRSHVELFCKLENPYLTGCHSVLYRVSARPQRLRPTPLIVHVCVLMFVVRDRIRAETGKPFVLDHGLRTLRPAEINSTTGASPLAVHRPAVVTPDESLQFRLFAFHPATHARSRRRGHYSPPNCSRLNSSSFRSNSSSMVNTVSPSCVSVTASSASGSSRYPSSAGTASRSAR